MSDVTVFTIPTVALTHTHSSHVLFPRPIGSDITDLLISSQFRATHILANSTPVITCIEQTTITCFVIFNCIFRLAMGHVSDTNTLCLKKTWCRIFAITSSNVNLFWKLFHSGNSNNYHVKHKSLTSAFALRILDDKAMPNFYDKHVNC